jgi:hypothetical protein
VILIYVCNNFDCDHLVNCVSEKLKETIKTITLRGSQTIYLFANSKRKATLFLQNRKTEKQTKIRVNPVETEDVTKLLW